MVIKTFFVAFILFFAVPSRAQFLNDWSTLDKTLLVTSTAANVVDWGQTRTIAKNPDLWRETNPYLGDHPSVSQVNNYFVARLILVPILAHYLPEYRTTILSIWLVIGVGYSGHNHGIGLRMTW